MRTRLLLAVGALASLGLPLAIGAPQTAIGATLIALPAALALLEAVRRELRARAVSPVEKLLGVTWLGLALHVDELGLRWSAELLAASLTLLLGWRVARLLPALLRRLGSHEEHGSRRSRWRWPFAAVPLAIGIALLPWVHRASPPNGDEPYYLLLAESLVSEGDLDLADEYREGVASRFTAREIEPQPGDRVGPNGEQRSRHESLLVLYLVPFWAAGGAFGCRLGMVALWALLAERLAALFGAAGFSRRGTLSAWALASFAPPLAIYAAQLWIEIPAALALTIALERWTRARSSEEGSDWRFELGFVGALLALPLLKLRLLAVALPLALVRLADRRRRPAALARLAGIASLGGLAALVVWRNRSLAGRALGLYEPSDFLTLEPLTTYLLRFDGLFFDLGFGLVAAGPIWLLALGGLATRTARRTIAPAALVAALPYLALVVSVRTWYGGWCPPFRYGIVLLPVFALGLAAAFDRRLRGAERLLAWTLGLASAIAALAFVVVPGWATSFADGRSRLADLVSGPFAADLARLLPSALRPRPAAWIVPLVAIGVLALVAWLARTRPGERRERASASVRHPELAAAATLLLLFSAALAAAHRLPSRVVEAEDPWVSPGVGALSPDPWTVDRTLEPGGRILEAGAAPLEIAPVAGGDRVRIRLVYRAHPESRARSFVVVSTTKGEELLRRPLSPGTHWLTEGLPERAWTNGERLRIALEPAVAGELDGKAIVDRVELDWR